MPCLKCLLLVLLAGAATARAQYVHASGQEIVDGAGKPLHLRGINLGNWMVTEGYMWKFEGGPQSTREIEEFVSEMLGPERSAAFWKTYRDTYITRNDIHRIKQAGFNSVRVPIHWKFFAPGNQEGFRLLDNVVRWSREEGLLVVIDLHAAPGGQTGANIDDSNGWPWLYTDASAQQATIDTWTRIAGHYKDETAVLGYDLVNEPLPHFPQMRQFDAKLEPIYKRIDAAIRAVDTHHAIILEAAKWDTDYSVFGSPFDPNTIYEFHTYWAPPEMATIQSFLNFREKYNVPLWLGESGENTDDWISSFTRLVEKNNIGWCFWPYKKMDATSSVVNFAPPDHWSEIVSYAKAERNLGKVEERQKTRPSQEVIEQAFAGLLVQIQYEHEKLNAGYLQALLPNSPVTH